MTGTLWSGTSARGDEVDDPARRPARARARRCRCTTSRSSAPRPASASRSTSAGVGRDEVARGDVIVDRRRSRRRYRVDAALEWDATRPDGGARVGVHHGTREVAGAARRARRALLQLRLEQPIVPLRGDRLVVRSLAPPDTLGGGVVLDPAPRRHGPSRDLLARLRRARARRGARAGARAGAAPAPAPGAAARSRRGARRRGAPARGRRRAAARRRARRRPTSPRCARTAAPCGSGPAMHVHPEALAAVTRAARRGASSARARSRSRALRDELGTSRKYAQA